VIDLAVKRIRMPGALLKTLHPARRTTQSGRLERVNNQSVSPIHGRARFGSAVRVPVWFYQH
jgi:hypothetical protein